MLVRKSYVNDETQSKAIFVSSDLYQTSIEILSYIGLSYLSSSSNLLLKLQVVMFVLLLAIVVVYLKANQCK